MSEIKRPHALTKKDTLDDAIKRADILSGEDWYSGICVANKDARRIVLLVYEYRKLKSDHAAALQQARIDIFTKDIIEVMARVEHDRWISWYKWQRDNSTQERIKWWDGLCVPYSELSEYLKQKDRDEVMKTIDAIRAARDAREQE